MVNVARSKVPDSGTSLSSTQRCSSLSAFTVTASGWRFGVGPVGAAVVAGATGGGNVSDGGCVAGGGVGVEVATATAVVVGRTARGTEVVVGPAGRGVGAAIATVVVGTA